METVGPRKVIAKVDVRASRPTARPVSPYKHSQPQYQQSSSSSSSSPPLDLLRPRAKVSSSAAQKRKVSGTPSPSAATSTPASTRPLSAIPRPASPTKSPLAVSRTHSAHSSFTSSAASDASAQRSKAALIPQALSRQRSLTGSALSPFVSEAPYVRERRGSIAVPLSPSVTNRLLSPESAAGAVRVKSRVSSLAKAAATFPASAPSSPLSTSRPTHTLASSDFSSSSSPYATTRPVRTRMRSPPVPAFVSHSSSSVPSSPVLAPSAPYPLSNTRHQPFNDSAAHIDVPTAFARVDPTSLPPLPQSPPASTVSFSSHSSRSSLSQVAYSSSSSSAAPTVYSQAVEDRKQDDGPDSAGQRMVFDALVDLFDPSSSSRRTSAATTAEPPEPSLDLPKSEGSQIRAAAKSNRKIEDLEITNRSLLAINATLEAAKHRQTKEILELRRKLRESRLILPPRAYRAVKSADSEPEEDEDEDDEDDGEGDGAVGVDDDAFVRVRTLIDGLLEVGKRALRSTPAEHVGAKVLSAEEVQSWRDDDSFVEPGPSDVSIEQASEDEVEAALSESLPSITVGMS